MPVTRQPPPLVKDEQGRIKMRSPHERERVLAIATRIVAGQVAKGEVDDNDPEALKKATREAVETAVVAFRAAEEYLCG
jgi:TPP-dependent pyruvate/acetoin dehydrogenase alpha subunit